MGITSTAFLVFFAIIGLFVEVVIMMSPGTFFRNLPPVLGRINAAVERVECVRSRGVNLSQYKRLV